jgi:hypothetical protein
MLARVEVLLWRVYEELVANYQGSVIAESLRNTAPLVSVKGKRYLEELSSCHILKKAPLL